MAQAQALEQALERHERVRKSTDLPLFYGDRSKDTIEPRDFLNRFNAAAQIANWVPAPVGGQPPNQARKCNEFYVLLRAKALDWWKSLENNPGINQDSWDDVERDFRLTFLPKFTARTACMSFSDLVQSSSEDVFSFFLRVDKAYRLLKETRPDVLFQVNIPAPNFGAQGADVDALALDWAQRNLRDGIERMGLFVVQAMFTAGLTEEIRIKTMEARCNTHIEARDQAMVFETVLRDKRGSKALAVASVERTSTEAEDEETEVDEEEDELLQKLNLIRRGRGRKPLRFAPKNSKQKVAVICRYCKKTGHFQRECFKRKKENGPMVDAKGKPMKFNSIEEEDDEEEQQGQYSSTNDDQEDDLAVQSISRSLSQAFYGISSIRETDSDEETLEQRQEWFEDTSSQNPLQPANNDHYENGNHYYLESFHVPQEPRSDTPDSWTDTCAYEETGCDIPNSTRLSENTWSDYYPNLQPGRPRETTESDDLYDEEINMETDLQEVHDKEIVVYKAIQGPDRPIFWYSKDSWREVDEDYRPPSPLFGQDGQKRWWHMLATGNVDWSYISKVQAKQQLRHWERKRTEGPFLPAWLFSEKRAHRYAKQTIEAEDHETGESLIPQWMFQIETDSSQHLNC
jgi:hypothetical protein